MNTLKLISICLLLFNLAKADETELRLWTGKNGNSLEARLSSYHGRPDGSGHIEVVTKRGKVVKIGILNLSAPDLEYLEEIRNGWKRDVELRRMAEEKTEMADRAVELPEGLEPDMKMNPSLIPQWSQEEEAGLKNSALGIWTGLLWWDKQGFLKVPEDGDEDDRKEWLEKMIERKLGYDAGDVIKIRDLHDKLPDLLSYCYDDVAGFKMLHTAHGYNYEKLAREAKPLLSLSQMLDESHLTLFLMTVEPDKGNDFVEGGLFESIDENGSIVVHINGKRNEGKLILTGNERYKGAMFDIEFSNVMNLPEYCRLDSTKFSIIWDKYSGGIFCVKAFRYSERGKKVGLPESPVDHPFQWKVIGEE